MRVLAAQRFISVSFRAVAALVLLQLVLPVSSRIGGQHATAAVTSAGQPWLVPLRREAVPVVRNQRVVSYRSAYSGTVSIGSPKQDFSVVFDTGSGHVILPSTECQSETCEAHRRYNISKSEHAVAINADGSPVPEDELCDQATIGFGTGTVTGEFVRERVCLGGGAMKEELCHEVSVVVAVEMSEKPFKSFAFDGVFGLGLGGLALSKDFSFFDHVAASGPKRSARFGVFLGGPEDPEASELALGGHNTARLLTPLAWAPVHEPERGHWQVTIRAVRVGGEELSVCRKRGCRGIVDTGTSHLGVPTDQLKRMSKLLTAAVPASDRCRDAAAPSMEFELEGGVRLSLDPEDYMRPRLAADAETLALPDAGSDSAPLSVDGGPGRDTSSRPTCEPKLMPVNVKQSGTGPHVFILGEPVLSRFYSVYDWDKQRVGFGLAATARGVERLQAAGGMDSAAVGLLAGGAAEPEPVQEQEEVILLQVTMKLNVRRGRKAPQEPGARVRVL